MYGAAFLHPDRWRGNRRRLTWPAKVAVCIVAATSLVATGCVGARPASLSAANPFFTNRFTATVNPYTFGQDPSWTADGRILSNESDRAGVPQIYVSRRSGADMTCLTCGQTGPNGFPQERPEGDWILFCSFRGQTVTFGAPCLGGIGSDLYAMRPDGSNLTRLTGPGTALEPGGTPYDNYHPYWSPDGHHIVWTHVALNARSQGGTQWTILLSTFAVDAHGTPHLTDVTDVGSAGDNAYETQVWAPDGSGVLYTSLSSDGNKRIGWLNSELYFMRLYGRGASPSHPQVTRLTDGNPGWDEQAVFTPDMKDVIWMSSRDTPTCIRRSSAAQQARYDPPFENEVIGPFFVLTVLDPKFRTDLYELDLRTHAIRRLTDLNQVVPEFYFNPSGTELIWTTGEHSHTYVGRFSAATIAAIRPPVPPDPIWIDAPSHGDHTPPQPVRATSINLGHLTLPPQEIEAAALLEHQLADLAHLVQGLPGGGSCCQASS